MNCEQIYPCRDSSNQFALGSDPDLGSDPFLDSAEKPGNFKPIRRGQIWPPPDLPQDALQQTAGRVDRIIQTMMAEEVVEINLKLMINTGVDRDIIELLRSPHR